MDSFHCCFIEFYLILISSIEFNFYSIFSRGIILIGSVILIYFWVVFGGGIDGVTLRGVVGVVNKKDG